jgi:hypothetical protein
MERDTNLQNVFGEIIKPIIQLVEDEEIKMDNDRQRYKLNFYNFTTNILFGIFSMIKSISSLVTEIQTSQIAKELGLIQASQSMYNEAFYRYNSVHFRQIFYKLLENLNFLRIPEIETLGKFICFDGSLFPAISTMIWAKYKSTCNAIKLHLSFNLNQMIPSHFIFTDGNGSERNALVEMIEAGITAIADRGYFSFELFKQIADQQAYFIIRGKENVLYQITETLTVNIPDIFIHLIADVTDSKVVFTDDEISSENIESNENNKQEEIATKEKAVRYYVQGLVSFLGEKLHKYWKLGLQWLIKVKNYLSRAVTPEIIYELRC